MANNETEQYKKIIGELQIRLENFGSILDLVSLLNAEKKFLPAAMTLCNELAAKYQCERVSLGWLSKKNYVKLMAMSHVDHFERKTEAVQMLEAAMEESFDQNTEIILPEQKDNKLINRDHQVFSKTNGVSYICSLPLRLDGEVIAICTFERNTQEFLETEIRLLRLSLDQVTRRLADLKNQSQWFGAIFIDAMREKLEKFLGCEHTWPKVIAILMSLILSFVCFVPFTYRVEGTAILRTQELAYLTAPLEGYIGKVNVRLGDNIDQNQPLLIMDQNNLLLDQIAALAEKNRYEREFEKARAANQLADMRIAEALKDQAQVKFDITNYHLEQSVIRAPFNCIVVEGDLLERIGSPVKEGDVLFKVARTDKLFIEIEVKESDIAHIKDSTKGEFALLSKPKEKFKMNIEKIEPAAVAKDKGNIFIVRGNLVDAPKDWFKPGMTGVGKINSSKHTLLWIIMHRTIDFLRLKLWW